MKTAKEMFEDMGYELVEEKDGKYYRKRHKHIDIVEGGCGIYIDIYFYFNEEKEGAFIDLKELKAINKQVEELGWLDA